VINQPLTFLLLPVVFSSALFFFMARQLLCSPFPVPARAVCLFDWWPFRSGWQFRCAPFRNISIVFFFLPPPCVCGGPFGDGVVVVAGWRPFMQLYCMLGVLPWTTPTHCCLPTTRAVVFFLVPFTPGNECVSHCAVSPTLYPALGAMRCCIFCAHTVISHHRIISLL